MKQPRNQYLQSTGPELVIAVLKGDALLTRKVTLEHKTRMLYRCTEASLIQLQQVPPFTFSVNQEVCLLPKHSHHYWSQSAFQ